MLRDPRALVSEVDHLGLHSKPGTREWIITRRSLLLACLSDIKNNRSTGKTVYAEIRQHGGWQHLCDLRGVPFRSFEQFCESANGLGLRLDEIERRLTAQELAASDDVPPQPERQIGIAGGKAGPGRGKKTADNVSRFGNSAHYLVARLKRDCPDVAERLARGEFRSARAAAIEARIVTASPRVPLTDPKAVTRKLIAQGDDFASEVMEGLRAYFSAKERE